MRRFLMRQHVQFFLGVISWIICSVSLQAEPRLVDIQSQFYGTSQRLMFLFNQPVQVSVYQDWEEQKIIISEPSINQSERLPASSITVRNFVISDVRLMKDRNGKSSIIISTPRDFVLKILPLEDQTVFGIDIFALVKPLSAVAYFSRGTVYESRNQYTKALTSYRKAITQRPGYPEAYFRAGLVRMQIGDRKNALINFQQIPDDSPLASQAALYIRKLKGDKNLQPAERSFALVAPESPSEPMEMELEQSLPMEKLSAPVDSVQQKSLDSTGAGFTKDTAKTSIPEKYAGWHTVELPVAPPQKNQQHSEDVVEGFWAFIAELNTFLSHYWHIVLPSGLVGSALLFLLIYKLWPRAQRLSAGLQGKQNTKKISKILDKELKKEINRRRSKIDEGTENAPAFAQKLVDLYTKTDSAKEVEIKRELEKEDLPRDPLLLDEELEKRGRIMNKMLGDVDSEAVRLTKQFRTVLGSAPGNPNKYEAVIQLKNQNWQEEDIARELNMGVEEVKLAVGMWEFRKRKSEPMDVEALQKKIENKGQESGVKS